VADGGGLRISDADRDQISEVLSEHAGEGRLTMDELDQRIGQLYSAQTRAQAAALFSDLPALDAPEPALPAWLTPGAVLAPAAVSPPTPIAHEDRAALRKRAKLRQDENAIGHTFQATRRAINARLSSAATPEEAQPLRERLHHAQEIADAARRAVAAGDRAEVQRRLAQLRALR
jgi:hypothetical protein